MTRKTTMQKEVEKSEQGTSSDAMEGQQMDLMDVGPKNAKEITIHARLYRAAQARRTAALQEEIDEKHKILELVKKAELKRTPNGDIKFHCDGLLITIVPRDELLRIKDEETPKE